MRCAATEFRCRIDPDPLMREDRRLLPGGKNKTNSYPGDQRSLLLLGRSGLGLEDLLDDVSLLDQECTGDPVSKNDYVSAKLDRVLR